eukprot:TRINITY_DN4189_c0_g1_i6.p1 TRINITY_DN4189_c0_g1~~TRINITY_DN4189_c0_g1_i6.p1  ORF type:complete len:749 (-),score=41.26 TRINITY_DN4189_c0_g1_i6:181-2427(-)
MQPTPEPTNVPTATPTAEPSAAPTTTKPTAEPTAEPTARPTCDCNVGFLCDGAGQCVNGNGTLVDGTPCDKSNGGNPNFLPCSMCRSQDSDWHGFWGCGTEQACPAGGAPCAGNVPYTNDCTWSGCKCTCQDGFFCDAAGQCVTAIKPPTATPSSTPTAAPTLQPTASPTTAEPTAKPTGAPTTAEPTAAPTGRPTSEPTATPSSNPTPGPTLRVGADSCYMDKADRAMPFTAYTEQHSVSECVAACTDGGYFYAGIEYGGQCFCGNDTSFAKYGVSTGCTASCAGNADAAGTCGGTWALTVYRTGCTTVCTGARSSCTHDPCTCKYGGTYGALTCNSCASNSDCAKADSMCFEGSCTCKYGGNYSAENCYALANAGVWVIVGFRNDLITVLNSAATTTQGAVVGRTTPTSVAIMAGTVDFSVLSALPPVVTVVNGLLYAFLEPLAYYSLLSPQEIGMGAVSGSLVRSSDKSFSTPIVVNQAWGGCTLARSKELAYFWSDSSGAYKPSACFSTAVNTVAPVTAIWNDGQVSFGLNAADPQKQGWGEHAYMSFTTFTDSVLSVLIPDIVDTMLTVTPAVAGQGWMINDTAGKASLQFQFQYTESTTTTVTYKHAVAARAGFKTASTLKVPFADTKFEISMDLTYTYEKTTSTTSTSTKATTNSATCEVSPFTAVKGQAVWSIANIRFTGMVVNVMRTYVSGQQQVFSILMDCEASTTVVQFSYSCGSSCKLPCSAEDGHCVPGVCTSLR